MIWTKQRPQVINMNKTMTETKKPAPKQVLKFALSVKNALDNLIIKDIENKNKIFGKDKP